MQEQGERLPAHHIDHQQRAVSEPCCLPLPQALAALFLMNNAHYQLKSVQASSSLNMVSHEWQDDCEAKVCNTSAATGDSRWRIMVENLSLLQ